MVLPADAVDPSRTADLVSMKSEPGDGLPDPMVFSVLLVFPQTFVYLLQKLTILPVTLRRRRKR